MNRSVKETWWPKTICHNTKYHFDNRFSIFLMHYNHVLSFVFMQREEFLSQSLELSFTNKQIPSG
jgi:hypothetical protein